MEINTVEKLIIALNTCANQNTESWYLDTMENSQIELNEWEKFFMFKEDGPARVLISSTESYQLFLSCWEKGQKGPIHDIDLKQAWIHPICGKFTEERYRISKVSNELEQVSSVLFTPQSYSYMQESKTIYRYINSYENRSVCLHLYCPPALKWREYDESSGKVELVAHPYDRLADVHKNKK